MTLPPDKPLRAPSIAGPVGEDDVPSPPRYPEDGLPWPHRLWAILTVGLAIAISVLDSSIANVALPTIAGDMSASPATAICIVNAYQLTIVMTLLPLASLGD